MKSFFGNKVVVVVLKPSLYLLDLGRGLVILQVSRKLQSMIFELAKSLLQNHLERSSTTNLIGAVTSRN